MFEGDAVCRAALYPKFISDGVFDEEILLNFGEIEKTGVYALSVASRFICRTDAGVHSYGCNAAELANDRFRLKNGREPEPLKEEVHYLGYYEFLYGDLVTIPMEYYSIHCYWLPEHGQQMHFQAEFRPRGSEGSKKQRRTDRQAAVGLLAAKLYGPARHLSKKDEVNREALEAIELPTLPRIMD